MTSEDMKKFIQKNIKYIAIAILVIVVIIIGFALSKGKKGSDNQKEESAVVKGNDDVSSNQAAENKLTKDGYPEVTALINTYFNAMANNDIESLKKILYQVTPENEAEVVANSERVESYDDVECYTKLGPSEDIYIAIATYSVKFLNIDTKAPGLLTFYICTNEEGQLYIYNTLDAEMKSYMQTVVSEDQDIAALMQETEVSYDAALASDENLKNYVSALSSAPADSELAEETQPETEAPAEETPNTATSSQEFVNGVKAVDDTVIAKENVNVRNSNDETADAIGKLLGGESVKRSAVTENGWSKVDYKGQVGYVKSEFVTTNGEEVTPSAPESSESETASSETEKVYVTETVNIRKSANEKSEKLGTAYMGESFNRIMKYADGWSKIEYNGQTAYVKSEFLETR